MSWNLTPNDRITTRRIAVNGSVVKDCNASTSRL